MTLAQDTMAAGEFEREAKRQWTLNRRKAMFIPQDEVIRWPLKALPLRQIGPDNPGVVEEVLFVFDYTDTDKGYQVRCGDVLVEDYEVKP
jgi:hypothetical protein